MHLYRYYIGGKNMKVENIVGLFEEISTQEEMLDVMSGAKESYSERKGNDGKLCTCTVECMQICSWF